LVESVYQSHDEQIGIVRIFSRFLYFIDTMSTQNQNHQVETEQPEIFCMNDLLDELLIYVQEKLQNSGKSEIEAGIFHKERKYRLQADRERLRRIFTLLLDNSVACIESGFITFGYYVFETNLVDYFVYDTRDENNEIADLNLIEVRAQVKQMGSRLREKYSKAGCATCSFAIQSEYAELV
jgi:hypothetical protein